MPIDLELSDLARLAVSLALGLLVGIQRGWAQRDRPAGSRFAGVRTFALVGLGGGISGMLFRGAPGPATVLLGAIAAARASRTYDNVILRVLGASRGQLLTIQLVEYGLLATVLALVALGLGSAMAWAVIVKLFEFDWLPDWPRVFAVLGAGLVLVLAFALAGSLPLLRAKPARALREL